jgi:RNA polymerase sigma-70 factor (ECF subfamily)
MSNSAESTTSLSLIERMRVVPIDQQAWNQFVERYGRRILQWCQRWNLQQADAEDVTQIVLLKLAEKLRGFAYDPSRSFRGWLKTVTHHAWRDYVDRRRLVGSSGNRALESLLESRQAPDDLNAFLEAEHQHSLLGHAMTRVQARVEARTWEAFRLQALERKTAGDVAAKLTMPLSAVFMAKSRVQAMLREEVRRLEGEA